MLGPCAAELPVRDPLSESAAVLPTSSRHSSALAAAVAPTAARL